MLNLTRKRQKRQYGGNPDFVQQLHDACTFGQLDYVKDLINGNKAPVDALKHGKTPLIKTLEELHNTDVTDEHKRNSLTAIVLFLINSGADVNFDNGAPLHLCASDKDNYLMRALIAKGADVNRKDLNGFTPLMHCEFNWEGVELLIDSGADVNIRNNNGETVLHHFSQMGDSYGAIDLFEKIIESGADLDAVDNNGQTPLHHAVLARDADLVEMFLEHGANPDVANNDGDTAMNLAISRHAEGCRVVLERYVGAHNNGAGENALFEASLQQGVHAMPAVYASMAVNTDPENEELPRQIDHKNLKKANVNSNDPNSNVVGGRRRRRMTKNRKPQRKRKLTMRRK